MSTCGVKRCQKIRADKRNEHDHHTNGTKLERQEAEEDGNEGEYSFGNQDGECGQQGLSHDFHNRDELESG